MLIFSHFSTYFMNNKHVLIFFFCIDCKPHRNSSFIQFKQWSRVLSFLLISTCRNVGGACSLNRAHRDNAKNGSNACYNNDRRRKLLLSPHRTCSCDCTNVRDDRKTLAFIDYTEEIPLSSERKRKTLYSHRGQYIVSCFNAFDV